MYLEALYVGSGLYTEQEHNKCFLCEGRRGSGLSLPAVTVPFTRGLWISLPCGPGILPSPQISSGCLTLTQAAS